MNLAMGIGLLGLLVVSIPARAEKYFCQLVILGSGPAGLTAALYGARAKLDPLIVAGDEPGGHLTETTYIENWPTIIKIAGAELMERLRDHAVQAGARILEETAVKVELRRQPFVVSTNKGNELICNAVILAMGSSPRCLNCAGEAFYWGKGVSTCATCDGAMYKNKDVVVVGGGDTAMEYALSLARSARSVTVVQARENLTASATMQLRVLGDPRIKIYYSSTVSEIQGDGERVTAVNVKNIATGQQESLPASGIFIAIGHSPNTSIVNGQVIVDRTGHIVVHDEVKTSVAGVFAAGDIMEPIFKQAIVAAGHGCTAALAAEDYLLATKQHRRPSSQAVVQRVPQKLTCIPTGGA